MIRTMANKPLVSIRDLAWRLRIAAAELVSLAKSASAHYQPFPKERPGKRPRQIDNPDKELKRVQRRIHNILLKPLDMPGHLHGGISKRSTRTNSSCHLGSRMLVQLDLKDFFPSIEPKHVYNVWLRLGCAPRVASLLTALTTYNYRLPQGAPTSSALANLALLDADSTINQAGSRSGCIFTRFVDDLSLSGDQPQVLIGFVALTVQRSGFRLSRKKQRIMPGSGKQEVTGLSVNKRRGPSISRKKRDRVRSAIHQLSGLRTADDFNRAVTSLRGRISYIAQTNRGSATILL